MKYNFSTCALSATRLSYLFKDRNISRDQIVDFLIKQGYIRNIRTATEYGLANGVSYCVADNGASYPVYDIDVQRFVCEHLDEIEKIPSKESNTPGESKRIKMETCPTASFSNGIRSGELNELNIDLTRNISSFEKLGIDDFVIIDTETTGSSYGDEVVELAIVDMDGDTIYHSLFEPYTNMTYWASRVNHITDDMLIGKPDFLDEWENIVDAVAGRKILCHNTPFDKNMIAKTLEKHGGEKSDALELFAGAYDSVRIAKKHIRASSHSLQNCAKYVGFNETELHRADDDCRMTLEFLKRLEIILEYD